MLKRSLFILAALSSLTGCRTSTDYPYNPNSVVYYEAEPVEEKLVIIPVRPYYRFDHQNQDYYHSTASTDLLKPDHYLLTDFL